ncbi:MAG TPA: Ig-like domain-containing protein [Gemmatimonadales bacterium]|nr:Ig-like domain-containing protein [Gemmatimonadales bacterium]
MRPIRRLSACLILGAISAACTDTATLAAPVAVAVVPPVDTLTKIGDTLHLTVIVGGHKAGPFEPISWTTLNGGVATVDSLGVVRAVAPGTAPIVATVSGQADTAMIWVGPPAQTLLTLSIAPPSITLASGATAQFVVSATWSDGSTTVPGVTYAAAGGTITMGGLYTAGATPGTFQVIATQQGGTKADTATVTIAASAPTLTQLVLTPASVTLAPAGTSQFAVSGTWSDGSSAVPAVTYAATGGTITAGGLYTAGATPGTFQVIATQQGGTKADSSVVTVTPLPPTGLALVTQPGGAVSGVAFTQQPVAELRNSQNEPVTQAGVVVTATIATGSGSLGGAVTATTNGQGRASFATLAIVGSGTFTLDFTAPGLAKATSQGIVVSAPAGLVVNAGADQTVTSGVAAALNATVTGAAVVNMFWTKISGPGKVSLASEQFNSTFDDLTLTDWIGGNQTTVRTTDAPFPDEVGIQGVAGNWYTTFAPPTTDRPRTGAHSWKAFTPYDSNHSAKLLKWNLDDVQAYFSVWVYWPSNEVVSGHGSGGFVDYLNLMQWKERSSPYNPTWVIAVTGLSPGVDQFAIHDWYNSQPIVHTGVPVPKDQWFNLTAFMKEGFGTSGELTVWLNHQLLYHQSGINTLGAATNTTAHLMWGIGNYSNALVGQGEQSIYFADAIVTPAADVTKTTATFAVPGTYVLRLTASDGTTTKSDDVTITVQ